MTTYEKICRERCQWCASAGHAAIGEYRPCTAPTRDDVIEQQAKRIAELERSVADHKEAIRKVMNDDFVEAPLTTETDG